MSPILAPAPLSPRQVNYKIAATYAPVDHRVDASMTMTWRNDGKEAVTTLPFHLYMNAFKNERSLFWIESGGSHRSASAAKDGWGEIALRKVAIDGAPLEPSSIGFPGPDETVMELPLAVPLVPGASVSVEFEFVVILPEVFARTGYKGEFAMIAQWFPKIGVRAPGEDGKERWFCDPFHVNSEFFADFGTYDVTLTVPDTHVVAATGVLVESKADAGTHVLRYQAEDVHDFAWMADPYMQMISAPAETALGKTEVRVYFREPQRAFAERHLRAGVGSIQSFSRRTVDYPWPIMSIIDPPPDAAGSAGGMEYPTLVTTAADTAFTTGGARFPEFVTVHEVGHNWFQGILASNEVDEAWLDEGVNQYVDGLVMLELYGDSAILDAGGFRAEPFELSRAQLHPISNLADPIAIKSHEFVDNGTYGAATYAKTAIALRTLEFIVGQERFAEAFKGYARSRAFTHPTGADFFQDLQAQLGEDLGWFIDPAFYGRGTVKLVVKGVKCDETHEVRGIKSPVIGDVALAHKATTNKWKCSVVVANLGTIGVSYDVRIGLAGGKTLRRRVARDDFSTRFELELDAEVTSVALDPDNVILLNEGGTKSVWRAEPLSGPAASVASSYHGFLQTILPMGGL